MALIVGDKEVPCAVPVCDWREHGMEFKVGDGARRRSPKIEMDLFVVHWTGGEGDAHSCYQVLETRELGVEFAIERDGDIFQFADPVFIDTFDAGPVNPRSVGVEITNYGFRDIAGQIPKLGRDRELYETVIRGKHRKLARFYPAQIKSLIALVDAVTAAIPTIPRSLMGLNGKLFTGTATRQQIADYKGVIGHFQLSDNKSDPGTDSLEAIAATGRYPYRYIAPPTDQLKR